MAKTEQLNLNIEGMHCAGCVANIERTVGSLDGVENCRVNLATRSAVVEYNSEAASSRRIISRIKELGFGARIGMPDILTAGAEEETKAWYRFRLSLLLSIPLMIVAMLPMFGGRHLVSPAVDGAIQAIFAAVVLFYAGSGILGDAFKQSRHLTANMNTLIALGTLTAFGWSVYAWIANMTVGVSEPVFFDSAGMIITLILLGRFLEAKSKGRAGEAIKALLKLQPSKTTAIINEVEVEIDAATLQPGMHVIVRPGERIPADGVIINGAPSIDESMLTGESVPVDKTTGGEVVGGSLNGNTPFRMEVTATGEDAFLAKVIKLVSEAQGRKAPVQRLADKVAGIFVPIVLGIALITLAIWLIFAPGSEIMMRSVISVLIIACPCALGLATPTAIMAGTGRAAREGIIIRGGDVLERISKVDTVVFDKTGTLTRGELEVVNVHTFDGLSQAELTGIVGAAETLSEHPIGKAMARYMKKTDTEPIAVDRVEARPGFGLTAEYRGKQLVVGNRALMERESISFDGQLDFIQQEMLKGRTAVLIALDGELVGMFTVSDKLRSEAKDVVMELRATHRVAMVSGDNARTAKGVARAAGLEHFEAEIKPDQKQIIVDSYRRAGTTVAMVGDGINDAPALAAADVGVAIGSGTDVAIEASSVVLVRPDLSNVTKMFSVARHTMRVIKQNLFWAFAYNVVAIPIAAGALYPSFGLTLTPAIAAAAMAFSSLFVVTNSLRLNRLSL